jgi:thiol-disulfide isomerase/thioredoxin
MRMNQNQPQGVKGRRPWWRRLILGASVGLILGICAMQGLRLYQDRKRSFIAAAGPGFPAGGASINSDGPLDLDKLRGKVVLLQFGFVGCVFCRKMDPYLLKWHERFASQGLTIIEVDDGKIDKLEKVRDWVARDKIPYPVYYDANGAMTRQYGISSYPASFLIGRDGKVVWEGGGWGGDDGIAAYEKAITAALGSQ